MLISIFAAIVLLGLSYLFLTAGYQKLSSGEHWQTVVADYQVLPASLVMPVVRLLPLVEISLALALLVSPLRAAALPALAALLSVYTLAMAVNLVRGRREIDCGCAGPAQEQSLKPGLVARNLLLLSLILWLWLYPPALPGQVAEWGLALVSSLVLFICLHVRHLLRNNNQLLRMGYDD